MDPVTKERLRIQRAIRAKRVSRSHLAHLVGLTDTVLIRVLEPDWNPTARTLAALSRALDAHERALDRAKKNRAAHAAVW